MSNGTIDLHIRRHPNGRLEVKGPLGDKLLAYGLLEAAKDVVRQHVDKQSESRIERPSIVVPAIGNV